MHPGQAYSQQLNRQRYQQNLPQHRAEWDAHLNSLARRNFNLNIANQPPVQAPADRPAPVPVVLIGPAQAPPPVQNNGGANQLFINLFDIESDSDSEDESIKQTTGQLTVEH